MKFTKMQGIGNDYVYVDGAREKLSDPAGAARFVSDRHFGIGSDGLILINPSDKADFEMEMYNSDGSRGKMCGNGIRCVGKYVSDHHLTDKDEITVETLAGIRHLKLFRENGTVKRVRVDMGAPILDPADIPVDLNAGEGIRTTLLEHFGDVILEAEIPLAAEILPDANACPDASGRLSGSGLPGGRADQDMPHAAQTSVMKGTCVSMGNPHCVVQVEDVAGFHVSETGPLFEHSPAFPEGVNTEFIHIDDRRNITMRVWERGSGETWACGTGACAAAAACILNGLTDSCVTVHLRGGDLQIEWDRERNTVYMTGPAVTVFEGEIDLK